MDGASSTESTPTRERTKSGESSTSWEDPAITAQLLAEMEVKEEQLLHAAEFGQALLQRTEELQEENETIARVAEEHEYRARELQRSLDQLAEQAATKDAELEKAKLSLLLREQQVEARMQSVEGTQAERETMLAEIQDEAEAAKTEAAKEIAQLKMQQAKILASEEQMREAREAEEQLRLALQKEQRETKERLAKHEEQQAKRDNTIRTARQQLEAERTEKQRLEEQLNLQRKEAAEQRERDKSELLLRSTAEFHEMREQLAKPGQVFSPDGRCDVDIPESPSLQDTIDRDLENERHRVELSKYEARNRELEQKLAEATNPPPASPTIDPSPELEPELESGVASMVDQAKACIRRGDEHMSTYETKAAFEEYNAGLALVGVKRPVPDAAARQRETTPLFDFQLPPDAGEESLFDSAPLQDGNMPATPSDLELSAVAAVRVELESKMKKARQLLQWKEDEFKARMLLDKGREHMTSQQHSSALTAFREGLLCCSDHPQQVFQDLCEEFHAEEAKAAEAASNQKQQRRRERQRLQEATKSGWLHKKGDKFKNFKRRWFVLDCSKSPGDEAGSSIEYFEHEGGASKGVVKLHGLDFDTVQASSNDLLQFWIKTPDRTFELLAPSFWEREHWIAAIHWALDAERAREIYGDGTKYQEIRAREEDMYVVLSVTNVQGDDPKKTYYEITVRHRRRMTSVTKRYSDFDELHTHLHTVSELYRSVLSGKVLSHDMGVRLNFLGTAGQGGGLEFPKKTWTDRGGCDEEIIAHRKEKLKMWLQRIFMIDPLKDEQKLLEFIGATASRDTVVTPRQDRDAPPWESDKEFELVDATPELGGMLQELILADAARSDCCDGAGKKACVVNLTVTRVTRIQNKVLWEDFRRRQDTIRQRSMLEGTPQVAELSGLQERLHGMRGGAASGTHGPKEKAAAAFPRIIDESDVNELRLWHGTTPEAAEMLVQYGFGNSDLDGRYGAGDYFSDCSSTAQEHSRAIASVDAGSGTETSEEESQTEQYTLLLCRVTCGTPYLTETTHQGHRRPPPNPANHNLPFDCIFAETSEADGGRQTHNEIVVFHGQQVYPEFLVEFTAKEELAL